MTLMRPYANSARLAVHWIVVISASYEVTQAQKAILQLDHTARGASTSSEELNAQISPRTDDEHNLPYHEDYLQEH